MTRSTSRPGASGATHPIPNNLPTGPAGYGFTAAVAERFAAHPVPGGTGAGRVIRVDRNLVLIATQNSTVHLPYPSTGELPATGDWVWLGSNTAGEPAIAGILPRHSQLRR